MDGWMSFLWELEEIMHFPFWEAYQIFRGRYMFGSFWEGTVVGLGFLELWELQTSQQTWKKNTSSFRHDAPRDR